MAAMNKGFLEFRFRHPPPKTRVLVRISFLTSVWNLAVLFQLLRARNRRYHFGAGQLHGGDAFFGREAPVHQFPLGGFSVGRTGISRGTGTNSPPSVPALLTSTPTITHVTIAGKLRMLSAAS